MKRAIHNIAPFLTGAAVILGFGISLTRSGNRWNARYGIFEWEPSAAFVAMAGPAIGGAGLGAILARMLIRFSEGELRTGPAAGRSYWWENGTLTSTLVAAGALALFVAVVVLK